jgi:hypothetical protein
VPKDSDLSRCPQSPSVTKNVTVLESILVVSQGHALCRCLCSRASVPVHPRPVCLDPHGKSIQIEQKVLPSQNNSLRVPNWFASPPSYLSPKFRFRWTPFGHQDCSIRETGFWIHFCDDVIHQNLFKKDFQFYWSSAFFLFVRHLKLGPSLSKCRWKCQGGERQMVCQSRHSKGAVSKTLVLFKSLKSAFQFGHMG